MRNSLLLDSVRLQRLLAASMRDYYTSYTRDHNQQSCIPANEGLAYISLASCASKLARSSASRSTNSLLIPWLHCPFTRESCDKNVTRDTHDLAPRTSAFALVFPKYSFYVPNPCILGTRPVLPCKKWLLLSA